MGGWEPRVGAEVGAGRVDEVGLADGGALQLGVELAVADGGGACERDGEGRGERDQEKGR